MIELLVESFVFTQHHRQCRAQRNAFRAEQREFLLDAFDDAPEAVAALIAARGGGDSRHGAGDRADRGARGRSNHARRRAKAASPIARLAALPAFPSSELPGNASFQIKVQIGGA